MKIMTYALMFYCGIVNADPLEKWECTDAGWGKVIARAVVNEGRESGLIEVAGVKHKSRFRVNGFNRRWDFGLAKDMTYNFAFIIRPNGDASYYDFSSESNTTPSVLMKCRQTK